MRLVIFILMVKADISFEVVVPSPGAAVTLPAVITPAQIQIHGKYLLKIISYMPNTQIISI